MVNAASRRRSGVARLRSGATAALLLAALIGLAYVMHGHYPLQHWLFFRYLSYWGAALFWSAACLVSGHAALRLLSRRSDGLLEGMVFGQAIGQLLFFGGMFAAGLLRLYGKAFALVWPAILVGAGLYLDRRFWRGCVRHLVLVRGRRFTITWTHVAILLAAVVGLLAIYFTILTPDNTSYDARWYHLRLAEQYAVEGGIRRSPEGWYQSTLPHLGSILYCWAFLLPRTVLFDRVEICAHMEFVLFLWTLSSVPALVRRLAGHTRATWSVLALLLFPKLFGYDSGLTVAADHIAAFWAIPVFLALMWTWRAMTVSSSVLLALMLSGAILTKYQSMYLLPFPIAVCLARAVWLAGRSWRRPGAPGGESRWLAGPAAALATGLLATAPHWLKNLLWYGDPLYPFLYRHLPVRPWTADSAWAYETIFQTQMWPAVGTFHEKAIASAKAMFTFSLFPNDWGTMFNVVPVFGFLFTVSLLVLPSLRRTRWIWALSASSMTGVFIWYWTHHQDRYLQILLPWMAAATAATMVLVWRTGRLHRVLLGAVVALQVIWGGDVYFASRHGMNGDVSILPAVVRLLAAGHKGDYEGRLMFHRDLYLAGGTLRSGDKVLVHETHVALGLRRAAVMDCPGWQGGISYGRLPTPSALRDQLASYGVTHLMWQAEHSKAYDSLAGDLKFHWFARVLGESPRATGGLTLAKLPGQVDSRRAFPALVAVLACDGTYAPGLYALDALVVPPSGAHQASEYPAPLEPLVAGVAAAWLPKASFIVHDPNCAMASARIDPSSLVLLAKRYHLSLYATRSAM